MGAPVSNSYGYLLRDADSPSDGLVAQRHLGHPLEPPEGAGPERAVRRLVSGDVEEGVRMVGDAMARRPPRWPSW